MKFQSNGPVMRGAVDQADRTESTITADRWPSLSVIVPIYNGQADLPDLVACLLSQDYPRDRVELILVDNHSRDRSWEDLQAAQTQAQAAGWVLKPIQENEIQSSYAARNKGVRLARGEILVFTDADCRPQPQWLREIVGPLSDDRVGMVAGEIQALSGSSLLERYADRQETLSQKHTLAHSFLPYGQTANLAVRRSVFQAIGLFRPHLTTGGDADIGWRMQQAAAGSIAFAPQAIVQHRHRATWDDFASQWRRYGRSNRYLHQLHGVPLMVRRPLWQTMRRWLRWLVWELPKGSLRWAIGRGDRLALWSTPIELLAYRERWRGQVSARLPDRADWIEPFTEPFAGDQQP